MSGETNEILVETMAPIVPCRYVGAFAPWEHAETDLQFERGNFVVRPDARIVICIETGNPGVWRHLVSVDDDGRWVVRAP